MSKLTLTILSADPLAPDNGRVSLFRKNDGIWYEIDDAGTVSALFGQASGTNLGSGVSLYAGLTGGDTLQFKSLQSTVPSLLTIAANGDGNHVDLTIEDALSNYTNDLGWASGTVTEVTVGTGLDVATGTTTPDVTLSLDELAEKTGDLVGTDRLVGLTGTTHWAETISGIPLSIFNNDLGIGSPLTTKGDVYTYDTADARLGVGTDGQVLTADSAEATGLKWATPAGTGDVTKVGTPVDSQLGVWTGDGTIEGDADLTFDTVTNTLALAGSAGTSIFAVGGANILVDSPRGTMTLSNIDALDATTTTTIQNAADPDTLYADVTDQLQVGFSTAVHAEGTVASGTFTPDEADGSFQGYTNGGAHTLAPPTNNTTLIVKVTNNVSAGAITTSGFTATEGDSFTTVNGDVFLCWITKIDGSSVLSVKQIV